MRMMTAPGMTFTNGSGQMADNAKRNTTAPTRRPRRVEASTEVGRRLFVLTGAGCSTNSGIPDYRDVVGNWKRQQPVRHQAFMADEATRKRYWARSLIGWRHFGRALPNDAHRALARLEAMGRSEVVLTQNVDRLHQAAGSERVIDLHGRLDLVCCMGLHHR
jgi:NAD-dependent SIR2 family protein deacetylase